MSLSVLLVAALGFGKKNAAAPPPTPPPESGTLAVAVAVAAVALAVVLALLSRRHTAAPEPEPEPSARPVVSLVYSVDDHMIAAWHMSDMSATNDAAKERVLAHFTPSVPVSSHKLTHNNGRVELVRNASAPRDFYSGWVQFVTLAHKTGKASVSVDTDVPSREVLLAAVTDESLVLRCAAGETLALDAVTAVAAFCAAAATETFEGVKYLDSTQFLLQGNKLGYAKELSEATSPANSPNKPTFGRRSSRSDLSFSGVSATPSTKDILKAGLKDA